ncbi:hypothetical protein NDA16_004573 [Ustilago loliicola]|nr:hypothetical protein NDA16_004573 [Ustilago loliicola]
MLSFFRKSSKSSVMAQANNSETTLVSVASTDKQRKAQKEPYQPEFTGMGSMGGMPSLGGHHFLPAPPVSPTESNSSKSSFTSGPGKLVPSQPFKSSSSSVVQERLSTAQSMFPPSYQPSTAQEKVEELFTPSAMMMGGGAFVVRFGKKESGARSKPSPQLRP